MICHEKRLNFLTASLLIIFLVPFFSCSTELPQERAAGPIDESALRILFLGNSHTAMHNVPNLVKTLVESSDKFEKVHVEIANGAFLEDMADNSSLLKKIRIGKWDFVVMQGQKISMSGRYTYSTKEAESLSKLANESGAKVVWFAEWGRYGVERETKRIEEIYKQISAVNSDIVSPVGRVWENAQAKQNDLALHSSDGNHANALGASLAALTLYASITGADVRELPTIPSADFGEDIQTFLKSVVWETLKGDADSVADIEPEKAAIQRVLDRDTKLGAERDEYCREHSLADTVRKYVQGIKDLDFDGCPEEFESAFINHATAWENSIPFFEKHPDLRGEMHELFEQIRSIDDKTKTELELVEKPIWDSWAEVEKTTSGDER